MSPRAVVGSLHVRRMPTFGLSTRNVEKCRVVVTCRRHVRDMCNLAQGHEFQIATTFDSKSRVW
eukprot:scaffold154639_cov33-Cyclotella_meneghiniana.AAC.1